MLCIDLWISVWIYLNPAYPLNQSAQIRILRRSINITRKVNVQNMV